MTNSTIDKIKNKATELYDDAKIKVKEAGLAGEKAINDVKHSAADAKVRSEETVEEHRANHGQAHSSNKETLGEKFEDFKDKAALKVDELKQAASDAIDKVKNDDKTTR